MGKARVAALHVDVARHRPPHSSPLTLSFMKSGLHADAARLARNQICREAALLSAVSIACVLLCVLGLHALCCDDWASTMTCALAAGAGTCTMLFAWTKHARSRHLVENAIQKVLQAAADALTDSTNAMGDRCHVRDLDVHSEADWAHVSW